MGGLHRVKQFQNIDGIFFIGIAEQAPSLQVTKSRPIRRCHESILGSDRGRMYRRRCHRSIITIDRSTLSGHSVPEVIHNRNNVGAIYLAVAIGITNQGW